MALHSVSVNLKGLDMSSTYYIYLACFFVVCVTLVGDYLVLISAKTSANVTFLVIVGGLFYGCTAIGWLYMFRNTSIAAAAVIYSAMTTVLLIVMGKVMFGQSVEPKNMVAAGLAVSALFMNEM